MNITLLGIYSTRLKTPLYNDHFKMPNRTCSPKKVRFKHSETNTFLDFTTHRIDTTSSTS